MGATTAFVPQPLPQAVAGALRRRLAGAHAREPFSPADVRATVRRTAELTAGLPVRATVYRGGLDLRGAEVDHVWLAVAADDDAPAGAPRWVVDLAFPLFEERFVTVLRRFVAGDATAPELEEAARVASIEARVLGVFPARMRYLGRPLWGGDG